MVGDHVTAEDGTGCVHTAPGHGDVDFIIGKAYGLEAYCPVDDKGCMTQEAGAFLEGQYVEKANDTVIAELERLGALLFKETITHAYPHDWRTKKPVIFRATDQWFASIDLIREKLLSEIDAVQWLPEWGKLRMHNMIKDRGDWCISRQRAWGVPIPIFYTESNQAIMDADVFKHVAKLFKEHGSNIWFEKEAKDLLPKGFTHPESPNGLFRKETDIMDVWFDSGSSHSSVIKERGGELPVDIYIEGSDQYRGWFNSSLIVSTAYNGHAPYKQVVSHGFVLDGKGEKMSKSLGNVIEPNKVVKEYGADVLRLWVASIDYQSDVRISDDILKQVIDAYKKMRNTFRFMLGNLSDFNAKDKVTFDSMNPLDQYMMAELDALLKQSTEWVSNYDYKSMTSAVSQFMSNTLSAYYLDYTKDILYIEKKEGHSRRSVQTVIYTALDTLVKLMAPVLVHTTEEVWDLFDGQSSVHLQSYPEVQNYTVNTEAWTRLFELRSMVLKALETVRADKVIGKSLEAKLNLTVNASDKALLLDYVRNLKQWLIVSDVELKDGDDFKVEVSTAEGHNCPRCWNIVDHVHENGLCDRCHEVLSQ